MRVVLIQNITIVTPLSREPLLLHINITRLNDIGYSWNKNHGKTMDFEGVINSDYKGKIRLLLMNNSARDVVIFIEGDEIAKIVLNEIRQASSLKENGRSSYEKKNLVQRGQNGFGSTGK